MHMKSGASQPRFPGTGDAANAGGGSMLPLGSITEEQYDDTFGSCVVSAHTLRNNSRCSDVRQKCSPVRDAGPCTTPDEKMVRPAEAPSHLCTGTGTSGRARDTTYRSPYRTDECGIHLHHIRCGQPRYRVQSSLRTLAGLPAWRPLRDCRIEVTSPSIRSW
jgi:hypothetical protein